MTSATRSPDAVRISYLGYPIVVADRGMELSTARAFIRGHRRETRRRAAGGAS